MSTDIATIIGYILFGISEILPLINIPANGFIHSIYSGIGNSFKNPEKDIELAQSLLNTKPTYANIINTIATNPQIQEIINNLLLNPSNANNITKLQSDQEINNLISIITHNPQLKTTILALANDQKLNIFISDLINTPNIKQFINNTELLNKIKNDINKKELN